jgi:hypothetical protein
VQSASECERVSSPWERDEIDELALDLEQIKRKPNCGWFIPSNYFLASGNKCRLRRFSIVQAIKRNGAGYESV